MTPTDAEAWARLRLVQGRSSAELWELINVGGHTLLTVGSAPSASWVVHEAGVAPTSFSLHWDGAVLRIADTHRVGNVRVDGAPVGQEWRALSGRVRIDFGQAAIVAETSGVGVRAPAHPLDATLPPVSARASSAPQQSGAEVSRSVPKATLLGVAPLTRGDAAPIQASVPAHASAPAQPTAAAQPPDTDSFRPMRPSDRARPHKPTLVGMTPLPASPAAPSGPAPAAPTSSGMRPHVNPLGGQTLLGVGIHDRPVVATAPASGRIGGASLADADQRTIQGFPASGAPIVEVRGSSPSSVPPGRRSTQPGVVSAPPGAVPGAVAQVRARPISDPALPRREPDSAQDEKRFAPIDDPSRAPQAGQVPQAVLISQDGSDARPHAAEHFDRLSDAPTEMRDISALEPRRRPFPWRYVGMALLTAVAYVAWLYLLDHI